MDIRFWLQEVVILMVVREITAFRGDLLESFRPREDNPPELNLFLNSVLQHRNDFTLARQAAKKYQKMKKDITDMDLSDLDTSIDPYTNEYKFNKKRNIHHYNFNKRKFRNLGLLPRNMKRNNFRRSRRTAIIPPLEKNTNNSETKNITKRFSEMSQLQNADGSIQKRIPSPIQAEKASEKHLPSQIFIEPEGEILGKRSANEITVESEGEKGEIKNPNEQPAREKKQALDLSSEVHKTYKKNPYKSVGINARNNQQGDFYYVDLEDAAKKDSARYNERRGFNYDSPGRGYYSEHDDMKYHRPFMPRQRPLNHDYMDYGATSHHNVNDEVAFEKALSYELSPKSDDFRNSYNNPNGNNLISVDAGRPDYLVPYHPQGVYGDRLHALGTNEYPPQDSQAITNEKFYVDNDKSLKRLETTTTESNLDKSSLDTQKKSLQHVGNGFIELTKAKRERNDEEPVIKNMRVEEYSQKEAPEKSSFLTKHSLHPLRVKDTSRDDYGSLENNEELSYEDGPESVDKREDTQYVFQSRRLQFIDYEMVKSDSEDENYDEVPTRSKRDFLDALGMQNEEDYTEDNPYKNEININNTDIHNDTHIKQLTSEKPCTTLSSSGKHHQKDNENVKNIKTILEEPTECPTMSDKKSKRKSKSKPKNKRSFENDYFDETRSARDADTEMETKIQKNKNRIYSPHEANKSKYPDSLQVREERNLPQWHIDGKKFNFLTKSINEVHNMEKKEDVENFVSTEPVVTETTSMAEFSPMETSPEVLETTQNSINNTYEQVAAHMDLENEKLAQVVNGQMASKIVSTVFDELKKKTSIKAKFYSGLSRKHVNFAGTIDFDIFKANETEDAGEARLLLDQITKVLNRLVLNQVRRKLCQRLPDELKDYLDAVLNVKNSNEVGHFVPNTQQGDFLFTYQEKQNDIPFDLNKVQDILVKLEGLLLSYSNLNEDCQSKAEPVKDYIEKHVKMLKQIVNCPYHNCDEKYTQAKRETHNNLLEKQLESVGLGKNQAFIPNFDLNQIVNNKLKDNQWKVKTKKDSKRSSREKSSQYKKLQVAIEKVREKRENDRKIAELFGTKKKRSVKKSEVDYEEPTVYAIG